MAWQEDGRSDGEPAYHNTNLMVVRIDTQLDLVFVRGHVPGVDNAHVLIKDAKKKMLSLGTVAAEKGLIDKVLPKGGDRLAIPCWDGRHGGVISSYYRGSLISHN